ncbi:nucleoid occlusion factor SlmA [Ramlibacter sp. H39-3-26]|uniref:nucleoid occlusion factor SlmA n=1 Tax=Curvibacter soli TaxID=3031331 RepID=UPI0023DAD520|nr:nucleoid occlusion factor SlmA [Ramlibacter sp. H39-3-26]MDF1486384.1 nucleoid occlusion factor SlmA [Ramlibacter sp. H39-3-26]
MPHEDSPPAAPPAPPAPAPAGTAPRRRPKPGERRLQILQTLAAMLQEPAAERVTTAALAARLGVSEAALYRHFASKAQMFEGLIDFVEQSVFTLVGQIVESGGEEGDADAGSRQAGRIVALVLQFGERNPGMVRVMVGDALVYEHARLRQRMNQFFDRIESTLRQCLRPAAGAAGSQTPSVDAQVRASTLVAFMIGRLQRYERSDFRRLPGELLQPALALML